MRWIRSIMAREANDAVCETEEKIDDGQSLLIPTESIIKAVTEDQPTKTIKERSSKRKSGNTRSDKDNAGDAGYESELPSGAKCFRMENEIEEQKGTFSGPVSGKANDNTDQSLKPGSSAADEGTERHIARDESTPLLQTSQRTEYNSVSVPRTDHGNREPSPGTEESPLLLESGFPNEAELRKRLWTYFDSPRRRWIKLRRCSIHVWFQIIKILAVFGLVSTFVLLFYFNLPRYCLYLCIFESYVQDKSITKQPLSKEF